MTEEHLVLANAPQAVYSILGCGMCSRRYRTALPSDGTLAPESRHQGRGDTCARGNTGNEEKTLSAIGQSSRSFVTGRTVVAGAIAGMVAGAVMAMYAMIASATFLHQGFFTPLYGIASPIAGQSAMMTSMQKGVSFAFGPALLGLVVHMMWSAMYGVVFALIARAARLRGVTAVIAGAVFGLAIQLVMSVIVLPILGLASMPGTIGLPSFTVEHLLFGLTLGLWIAARPHDVADVAGGTSPRTQVSGYGRRSA